MTLPDFRFYFLLSVLGGYFFAAVAGFFFSPRTLLASASAAGRTTLAKNLSLTIACIASLSGCLLGVDVILSSQPFDFRIGNIQPWGEIGFHIDALSAFFLCVISGLGAVVSIYSAGYVAAYFRKRNVGLLLFLYNMFLLSMVWVVLADNVLSFLIGWEVMSLTVYFLITYEHDEASSHRAGFFYVVMTHIGTAFLLTMFLLMASHAGSLSFGAFRTVAAGMPESVKTVVFFCALIGFGIKAGIIPFHTWLPEAHPAAPSNISALMSGVMIKMGIYGMVRVFFDFLGSAPPAWWGILVLGIAALSAVLGVLFAIMEHDLKRLLAFHSIENIGIILLGVGAALIFSSFGNPVLAGFALMAGLFHVLNHAAFKGLLFLGAGSVVHATGTKNIEELGGLIRRLPWTSVWFLVGAAAISALPPLNGFVSEWLTFQSLLLSFTIPDLAVRIAAPLAVALLALTGALAAACFVKAYGITFLGLPRSERAANAHEAAPSMLWAMGILAVMCVAIGVFPGAILTLLRPVAASLFHSEAFGRAVSGYGSIVLPQKDAPGISPFLLAMMLVACFFVPLVIGSLMGKKLKKRSAMTWACGLETVFPRMQYSATGFSKPIRMIFSNIFRARREIEIAEESSPYFKPAIRYELKTESMFDLYLYAPVNALILRMANAARRIQTGRIQTYLAYIFITLILLLLFAR